jgi:predicted metal-dependent phosphoesterase TrpH
MDCNTSLEQVINRCLEVGINCIAIADHGTAEGALRAQDLTPFPVIVAEEILTPHGEIMGMFLKDTIPSGLSVEQTISLIKDQNGLVCIPHPFDTFRPSGLDNGLLEELADQIDIVEVFNARSPFASGTNKALTFARQYNIPVGAGSDAHTPKEIGNAYVEISDFSNRDDFLQALAQGKILGHRTNPLIHFASAWARLKKQF